MEIRQKFCGSVFINPTQFSIQSASRMILVAKSRWRYGSARAVLMHTVGGEPVVFRKVR